MNFILNIYYHLILLLLISLFLLTLFCFFILHYADLYIVYSIENEFPLLNDENFKYSKLCTLDLYLFMHFHNISMFFILILDICEDTNILYWNFYLFKAFVIMHLYIMFFIFILIILFSMYMNQDLINIPNFCHFSNNNLLI